MNSAQSPSLEELLGDIYLPEAVGYWPLAWGWWVVIVLAVVFAVWLMVRWWRTRQKRAYLVLAQKELQLLYADWQLGAEQSSYLQQCKALIQRCLNASPQIEANKPVWLGEDWRTQVEQFSQFQFSKQSIDALTRGLYQLNSEVNIEEVHAETLKWLKGANV